MSTQHTPLMQQYHDIKNEYPDTLLFFQVGDFYELFFDDARTAASFLGIALTARGKSNGQPIPLCGVPMHAKDHYVAKLIKGGFKVAICDQLEAPRPGELVRRGVTNVLTPGTLIDAQLLDEKTPSYLFSFFPAGDSWGLLFGEILTAQLFATIVPAGQERLVEAELSRFFPQEILVPNTKDAIRFQSFFRKMGYFTTPVAADADHADERAELDAWIAQQFKPDVAQTVSREDALRCALYAFYAYVRRTNREALNQFRSCNLYETTDFLVLDAATQRNLEIVKNNFDGSSTHTLVSIVDHAVTPMGSRMVRKWLLRPLVSPEAIAQRLDVVALLKDDLSLDQETRKQLQRVGDIERMVGRIALKRATLNDYRMLASALNAIAPLKKLLHTYAQHALMRVILGHLPDLHALCELLGVAINDDENTQWMIKPGFDEQLDELRDLVANSGRRIVELERSEQAETGIQSLKIRYNNVHGYYIEVTKPNMHLVPDRYIRQQTLAGRERYITPELQGLQHEIYTARARVEDLEKQVFERVQSEVYAYVTPLRKVAHAIAHLDALYSFAVCARDYGYTRPNLNNDRVLHIEEGRHPVVEQCVDGAFIANDATVDDTQAMWIITGPNMGGKSTFLRQVALMSVLAHCGSFVPATSANIPVLDRVFTRIGSGDHLAGGKSTFLVEMEETAAICAQATKNSLVILDEVGRGTSTFDGLAIAQAVVEYLHERVGARCLFATHYHELTHLESDHPGIVSYYAASSKTAKGILFLYKMIRGVADGSFGIDVAQCAQLPETVIDRARELVVQLKLDQGVTPAIIARNDNTYTQQEVAALHAECARLKEKIHLFESINLDELSPRKAFDLLWRMKAGE